MGRCDLTTGDQDGFVHTCRHTTERHEEHECPCGYRWKPVPVRNPQASAGTEPVD